MRVRFWGTRGSIATPGPGTVRFGGNTSCVGVTTSGGACFIFDCGTGVRPLGAERNHLGDQRAGRDRLLAVRQARPIGAHGLT